MGAIHVAGFSQAAHMANAGTSSVTLQATSSSGSGQVVTFNHSATTFAPGTSTTVKGYAGIKLYENVTATTGTLTLDFATGDLELMEAGLALTTAASAGNLVFASSGTKAIAVRSTPARIEAAGAAANITLNVPLNVTRHASSHGVFTLAAGNVLQCVWPSTGIVLAGAQAPAAGASVVLESADLWWNASAGAGGCQLLTLGTAAVRALDAVWIKPNCDGDACALYLGDFRHDGATSRCPTPS